METTTRVTIDCRQMPSESKCSLAISGTEAEVLKAAAEHAVSSHGHTAGPELTRSLRGALQPEGAGGKKT
jgi:hypothetical protein